MRKLLCYLFFHKIRLINTFSNGTCQKLYCKRCRRYFGINHNVRAFIPWDSELEYLMNKHK